MLDRDVKKVWEELGVSHDNYMMLYWDFKNKKVMAIDHVFKHVPVGELYDIVIKDDCLVSLKVRKELSCELPWQQ